MESAPAPPLGLVRRGCPARRLDGVDDLGSVVPDYPVDRVLACVDANRRRHAAQACGVRRAAHDERPQALLGLVRREAVEEAVAAGALQGVLAATPGRMRGVPGLRFC